MFYLETKDGDKFFTDSKSNDKVEFWRILDQKLGRQAANMFDEFIKDVKQEAYERLGARQREPGRSDSARRP